MRTQQGTDFVSLLYAKQILMQKQISIHTQFLERAEGSFRGGWQNQDRIGPDRTGPDRIGSDRTGLDRTGPDRTGPDRDPWVTS